MAQAAVLDVGAGHLYPTVGEAVAAAADGDVILVHDALVAEDVVVDGRQLTIRSASRATWQHVAASGRNLEVRNGASVRVVGFDFVGDASYNAISVADSELVVRSSTFERFAYGVGGYGSTITLHDSVFRFISTTAVGAGTGTTLVVTGSSFVRNGGVGDVGAIWADRAATIDVRRTVFAGNRGDDGAVNCGDADFALGATDLVGVDPMSSGAGAACSWNGIRPLPGSPLIDGDPTLLDRDGTPADIGATGGPSAP